MQNNIENQIKRINGEEFEEYFNSEMLASLAILEKKRIKDIISIIALLLLSIIFVYITIINILAIINYEETNHAILALSPIIIVIPLLAAIYIHNKYKNTTQEIVLPKLLNFIGDFHIEAAKPSDHDYIKSLNIFGYYNRTFCGKKITITYNSVPIDIQNIALDIKIRGTRGGSLYKTVFNGILLKIPCCEELEDNIIIKSKFSLIHKIISFLNISETVKLNAPLFSKYYDIYTTDETGAKYLIKPSFIQKMVQLAQKRISKKIYVSFEQEHINIAISSRKNWFEVPLLKPTTDIRNYKLILYNIMNILSIIDSLKINKKVEI